MLKYFTPDDEAYVIRIRRELHSIPELLFDLPKTVAVVKRELDAMGISYTEQYGQCSVVATLNDGCKGPTVGLRADMDALPLEELADVPYKSTHPGKMHACGHDCHAAMLLGAARVMKRMESELPCRVKLLFQPSEEGAKSGAEMMVKNGVMEDIDFIFCEHVENGHLDVGKIGYYPGYYMAACHPYTVIFHGKSVHATLPQNGHDALAMAVKAYNDIYLMKARELDPFSKHVISVSSIQAGYAHNVIAETATMLITFRFYEPELHEFVNDRIHQLCRNAAEEMGGTVEFHDAISCPAVYNDPALTEKACVAARKVVGDENVIPMLQKVSSEDFAHYLREKPGVIVRVGTRNEAKGCTELAHTSHFMPDEDGLINGCQLFLQFVMEFGA